MDYQSAGYVIGPGIEPSVARNYFNAQPAGAREFDHESDAADYDANETRRSPATRWPSSIVGDKVADPPGAAL